MKRIVLLLTILFLSSSAFTQSQTKMFINKTSGTDSVLLSEIKSITFKTSSSATFSLGSKVYNAEKVLCEVRSTYYLMQASIGSQLTSNYAFCNVEFYGSNSQLPTEGTYKVVVGATPPNTLPLSDEVTISIFDKAKSSGLEVGQSGALTVSYVNNRPIINFNSITVKNSASNLSSSASGQFGCP